MPDWSAIKAALKSNGVTGGNNADAVPVSGGDISAAWRLGDLFLKTGPLTATEMFAAEASGLIEIARTGTVRVPHVLAHGNTDGDAYLALEWLRLEAGNAAAARALGEQLAAMHRISGECFGWHRDNTIGLTPQRNNRTADWVAFFRDQRLGFQLQLAAGNGFTGELQEQGARLLKRLPLFFDERRPQASLLHGDLWGGNWATSGGQPILFDPAVYYGDRETDLAMTRLFGGFGAAFYEAYDASWPLADGSGPRQSIYQLYHVLNHLNLFGSAYLNRALELMRSVL